MPDSAPNYSAATRHPWACLVFLLPLLAVYEVGVYSLGGQNPDTLRNGADAWMRWGLARYGFAQPWAAPALIVAVFVAWSVWAWGSRPKDLFTATFGMLAESVAFAVGLWAVGRNFLPLLQQLGLPVASVSFQSPAAAQVVTFVGAGIYEEVLFRLCLFTLVRLVLRAVLLPGVIATPVAAVFAAGVFVAAHHMGDHGEPLVPAVVAFRMAAGLYFTALYVTRGFGVAVGAHAGYDVLVGVAVSG
jgi:Type II CAAX prenyl endopeptidase Rce1-like